MPPNKRTVILIAGSLLGILSVVAIVEELVDGVTGFLVRIGLPAGLAANQNSVLLFGLLLMLVIFGMKSI